MILQRQHKRELCGPSKCAFRAGGVRRSGRWKVGWEGEKLMGGDIVLGEGEAKFDDKASVVLEQPWHYDTVDSQKYTVAQPNRHGDPSPPPPRLRNWDRPLLNLVIPAPVRFGNLKLLSQVTQSRTKNWAKIATSETVVLLLSRTRWRVWWEITNCPLRPYFQARARWESFAGGTCTNFCAVVIDKNVEKLVRWD